LQTLNGILPHYSAQLDSVAANLASVVNAQHKAGYDLNGNQGVDFFVSSDSGPVTAASITVGITLPDQVAASVTQSATGGGTLDGSNADALGMLASLATGPDQQYRQVIAGLGVAGQTADRQAGIQGALMNSVDSAREAQSGVNIDEEMTHLIAYQHAYQAAARVLNTVDGALDTLINHTGG
jgi:flagellar hook-associated protein 1 FlgK